MIVYLYTIKNNVKTLITTLKNKHKAEELKSILDFDEVILEYEKREEK
jgi:hypothetical protein